MRQTYEVTGDKWFLTAANEIDNLWKLVGRFRLGLQVVADNPEWLDHHVRASAILKEEDKIMGLANGQLPRHEKK